MDVAYPQQRTQHILEDSAPQCLISESHTSQNALYAAAWLSMDTIMGLLFFERVGMVEPESQCFSAKLAYVIFTSGTTGRPKGVLVEHRSGCNMVAGMALTFETTASDRVLQFYNIAFDATVSDIFQALASGAALTLWPTDTDLVDTVAVHLTTSTEMTPSGLSLLRDNGYASFRLVAVGGEACPASLIEFWAHGRKLVNSYGPTECTVTTSNSLLTVEEPRVTIGRPLPGYGAYVTTEHFLPLPLYEPAELSICGVGVARGYLKRPTLTERVFVRRMTEVFNAPVRLYKSGDLCRWLPNRSLECHGRIDHQIKLRGFRIELGEVEAALESVPGVAHAIAALMMLSQLEIVACVTPGSCDIAALEHVCGSKLPYYMRPVSIMALEALPLTSNGKLCRKTLPTPEQNLSRSSISVAPRNGSEMHVHGLCQLLLAATSLSVHDNLLHFGLHSIAAMMLARQMQSSANLISAVNMAIVFQSPTIAELAEMCSQPGGIIAETNELYVHSDDGMILLQPGSKDVPPLVLVYASHGLIYGSTFPEHVPSKIPIVAMQAPELAGNWDFPRGLEARAKQHALDLLERFPSMTHANLVGYCLGSWLSSCMARCLQEHGCTVSLVLVDPSYFDVEGASYERQYGTLNEMASRLDELRDVFGPASGSTSYAIRVDEGEIRTTGKLFRAMGESMGKEAGDLVEVMFEYQRVVPDAWISLNTFAIMMDEQQERLQVDKLLIVTMSSTKDLLGDWTFASLWSAAIQAEADINIDVRGTHFEAFSAENTPVIARRLLPLLYPDVKYDTPESI